MFAAASLFGCGTTLIVTNEPGARIWANGRLVGRGQAQIDQRGTPETSTILVKADDGRQERTVIKRRFTGITFLAGIFTYGVCLFACWEYPNSVFVALPPTMHGPATAGWEPGGALDPWLVPPPGWRPR